MSTELTPRAKEDIELLSHEDPRERYQAAGRLAVALGNAGLESGVQHLAKLIEDEIPFTRAHTAIALAQIGHKSGLPYLENLAEDSMPRVAKISEGHWRC